MPRKVSNLEFALARAPEGVDGVVGCSPFIAATGSLHLRPSAHLLAISRKLALPIENALKYEQVKLLQPRTISRVAERSFPVPAT